MNSYFLNIYRTDDADDFIAAMANTWIDNGHHSRLPIEGLDVSVCKWAHSWWFGIQQNDRIIVDGNAPSRAKAKLAAEAALQKLGE